MQPDLDVIRAEAIRLGINFTLIGSRQSSEVFCIVGHKHNSEGAFSSDLIIRSIVPVFK